MRGKTELIVFGGQFFVSLVLSVILLLKFFGVIDLPWWAFILFLLLLVCNVISMSMKLWLQHTLLEHNEQEQERLRKVDHNLHWASKDLEALKQEIDKILKQW